MLAAVCVGCGSRVVDKKARNSMPRSWGARWMSFRSGSFGLSRVALARTRLVGPEGHVQAGKQARDKMEASPALSGTNLHCWTTSAAIRSSEVPGQVARYRHLEQVHAPCRVQR